MPSFLPVQAANMTGACCPTAEGLCSWLVAAVFEPLEPVKAAAVHFSSMVNAGQ